jgi:hypothetical protein
LKKKTKKTFLKVTVQKFQIKAMLRTSENLRNKLSKSEIARKFSIDSSDNASFTDPRTSDKNSDTNSITDPVSKNIFESHDEEEILIIYSNILDHLLTPELVKQKMIATQSLEKKIQFIKMHNSLLQTSKKTWTEKEEDLLDKLKKSKFPDLPHLNQLKLLLSSADREIMSNFLNGGGVHMLVRMMEHMSSREPLTEFDFSLLYEIMSCCKLIMNNSLGMDGFLSVDCSVQKIALCLTFENKAYSLLVSLLFSL